VSLPDPPNHLGQLFIAMEWWEFTEN
jgi:hypothetical protein